MTASLPPPPRPRPRFRWWHALILFVAVVAIAAEIANQVQLKQYAISPGSATPIDPRITLPPGKAAKVKGSLLLTDVLFGQISALQWVFDQFNSDVSIYPEGDFLGPDTTPAQLEEQGFIDMAQSQLAAKVTALRALGYSVGERSLGVVIYGVDPSGPAGHSLQPGEVITGVGSTSTPSFCALQSALGGYAPGDEVPLDILQTTATYEGVFKPAKTTVVRIKVVRPPSGLASACPGATPPKVYFGFSLPPVSEQVYVDYSFPFPISINTNNIGGPSAGLAMTLGIINKLGGGDLTGGRIVAATGTIDAEGEVGDVGGVPQKTIAVERAGASVFFVPVPEYKPALSKANPQLHVYAVSTLSQALAILKRLGGHVPASATA